MDMFGYDVRRFHPDLASNTEWVKERSHEAYAKNYHTVYLHDQPLAGRNMIKDPFHELLLREGCVFEERQGWERPGWFDHSLESAPVKEYDWYGAYDHQEHKEYTFRKRLEDDYTFDYPANHQNVSFSLRVA